MTYSELMNKIKVGDIIRREFKEYNNVTYYKVIDRNREFLQLDSLYCSDLQWPVGYCGWFTGDITVKCKVSIISREEYMAEVI